MKAHHPRERFWGEAELGSKAVDEMLAAPADLLRQSGDPDAAAAARQLAIGEFQLRRRQVVGALDDKVLDDIEAALPAIRSAEALAQPRALDAEHVIDFDHARGEIDHGAAEKPDKRRAA